MDQKALLVIDMLNDFLLPGAPLEVPSGRDIVPALASRIRQARADMTPVIYVCDSHDPKDAEFAVWPAHCVRGTPGSQVIHDLAPREGDTIVEKTRYSGFFGTDLEKVLEKRGVRELAITGILTNICVLYTACDAYMRGYRVTVPVDCVAALTEEEHRFCLGQMEKLMEARLD